MESTGTTLPIEAIVVNGRHRRDLGDINALASSIKQLGLLHPVVVTKDNQLIAGERRLAAAKLLGWDSVPVTVADSIGDALTLLLGERDENTCRKDFAPSEAVAIGQRLEELERPEADQRRKDTQGRPKKTGGKLPPVSKSTEPKTRDKVAAAVGLSGRTYEKAKEVVQSGDTELIAEMDRAGKVERAHKALRKKRHEDKQTKAAASVPKERLWTVTDSQMVVPCDVLITDPPYGIIDQEWEPQDLQSFTRDWVSRWCECKADIVLVFWSQRYLWDGRRWFDNGLKGYSFQQLLVWHYPNNKSPQNRQGFKQTWEPIFFYRRDGATREVTVNAPEWGDGLNDFDCHVAAVPQSNFNDADMKQHPAQKPVSVMRWLVSATTLPSELVCDPFAGSGTTGIAATQLGRRFHGIESNSEYRKLAEGRLATYGK